MTEDEERKSGDAAKPFAEPSLLQIEATDDDTLEERLHALVAHHERERATLAEQISNLRLENQRLLNANHKFSPQERGMYFRLRVSPKS